MKKKLVQKNKNNERPLTLITGASSGIGEAVAYKLAKNNYPVLLVARRTDKLKAVQKKCLQLGAPYVEILKLDLLQNPSTKLKSFLKIKKIKIENLVNSAGLAQGTDLFQSANPKDWDQMVDTNIKGLLQVTHAVIPSIIESKGTIINLGSVAGRLVYEGGAVYCATKFAVRAISEGLRMDLKGTGVRVVNIEPGMVNTEFSLVRLGNKQKADAVYADMMPLMAEDVANSIFFCLSQPAHVNIQELVIYPTDQASVGQVVRGDKSLKNLLKNKN